MRDEKLLFYFIYYKLNFLSQYNVGEKIFSTKKKDLLLYIII